MLRIGVVEICSSNHYSLLETWQSISIEANVFCNFYLTDEIKSLVNNPQNPLIHFHTINKLEEIDQSELDIIIINSATNKLIDFARFKFEKPGVLHIHNINTWFPKKLTSIKVFTKHIIRKIILRKISSITVCSTSMKLYLQNDIAANKAVETIPFSLYYHSTKKSEKSRLRKIVFPGIISRSRKNYEIFMGLAQEFEEIEFVLLGAPATYPIDEMKFFNTLKEQNLKNLTTFDKFIPRNEFEFHMRSADLIFGDLNVNYWNQGVLEKYGETKDSGISYLMIEYSTPAILNREFSNIEELETSSLYFSNLKDAIGIIEKILDQPTSLNRLQAAALKNSEKFTASNFKSKILEFLYKTKKEHKD